MFTAQMQDGRGSVAFVRLLNRLREMKRAGRITRVVAFDVGPSTPPGQDRNAVMAQNWRAISASENGLVLALVGNVHAMRKPVTFGSRTIVPAASLMPADRTVTLNIVGAGGKAWICLREGCGERDVGPPRTAVPGIAYSTDSETRWGATYALGVPTTAAPPAVPQGHAAPDTAQ